MILFFQNIERKGWNMSNYYYWLSCKS